MTIKRYLGAASAAALLALSLSACGGDDVDAPEDASESEFCDTFNSQSDIGAEDSADDQADAAQKVGEKLEDVGTPKGIPDDARKGFESYVKALKDIDGDDVEKLADADEDAAAEALDIDKDEFSAFFEYAITTCVGDLPTDIPTDVPTE